MKRLYLTVEGQTEAAFAMGVLQGHLATFNVFLYRPRFTGLHSRRRGRIPAGGLLNTFVHTLHDIRTWLKEDQSPDARFSMMVDLYHLPHDFPGYDDGMAKPTGWEQAEALEQSLREEIGDPRFIAYLQVHEFEALVLTDPARIEGLYPARAAGLGALCEECRTYQSPEQINHGHHSHPKARVRLRIPEYDENVAGPLLAEEIGLVRLRTACPHFGQWLTSLEQLDAAGETR
jgi:hypothetical protein